MFQEFICVQGSIQRNLCWSIFYMCEKTMSKKQCYSVVVAPEKPWSFRGHTIMSTLFVCFSYENQICPHWYFLCFSPSQTVIILVAGNKRQKFRKSYWISNKSNNVTCVIGWFFIILFSFYLSFICTSFMFVVGSCGFDAPENLKCVRLQTLIDIIHHKFLILFIIPRETLYSPKTYLPYVTSAFIKTVTLNKFVTGI